MITKKKGEQIRLRVCNGGELEGARGEGNTRAPHTPCVLCAQLMCMYA